VAGSDRHSDLAVKALQSAKRLAESLHAQHEDLVRRAPNEADGRAHLESAAKAADALTKLLAGSKCISAPKPKTSS
jgi:hypothetical protein